MIDSIESRALQAFRNHGQHSQAAVVPVLAALQAGAISTGKAYECILRWLDGENFAAHTQGEWDAKTPPVATIEPTGDEAPAVQIADVVVYADGGSRGNPGPAAGAAVIVGIAGEVVAKAGKFIPFATNNVAEYTGALEALALAAHHGAKRVEVRMDSELVVKQMQGLYRVRHPDMIRLHAAVSAQLTQFESVQFTHVDREHNAHADQHTNDILDAAAAQ